MGDDPEKIESSSQAIAKMLKILPSRGRGKKTGECLQTLKGHNYWVQSVAYSPNGKQLASASLDQSVKLWNTQTGEYLQILKGHSEEVWSVAYSPNGKQLASASDDQSIKFWNTQTGECITTIYAALPQQTYATVNEAQNRITHASKEAWRYFRYEQRDPKTGKVTLWPAETFEELP